MRAGGTGTTLQRDAAVERLLAPVRALPQGDDRVWHGRRWAWRRPEGWTPAVTAWLSPRLGRNGIARLKPGKECDLCWDDRTEWTRVLQPCLRYEFGDVVNELAGAIEPSVLRTYHGCRTDDAGSYFRNGLRVHDRATMVAQVRAIVDQNAELHWMRSNLDTYIARVPGEIDAGRVYVVVNDQVLLEHGAHYLINGSEWVMAVLGEAAWNVLRRRGVPTLLEIDLPLSMASRFEREQLASCMLLEWTRIACNQPSWSAPIDFSFSLTRDVPPECIVVHSHPAALKDPHNRGRIYRPTKTVCVFCG